MRPAVQVPCRGVSGSLPAGRNRKINSEAIILEVVDSDQEAFDLSQKIGRIQGSDINRIGFISLHLFKSYMAISAAELFKELKKTDFPLHLACYCEISSVKNADFTLGNRGACIDPFCSPAPLLVRRVYLRYDAMTVTCNWTAESERVPMSRDVHVLVIQFRIPIPEFFNGMPKQRQSYVPALKASQTAIDFLSTLREKSVKLSLIIIDLSDVADSGIDQRGTPNRPSLAFKHGLHVHRT